MQWLYSTNAKEIGTLYLMFAIFSGMIGTAFSVLIRLELAAPGVQFLQGDHQLFNVIISAHAFIMIFFMVMPGLVGGFGNYILPVQCGAVDMAKEKIKNQKKYSILALNLSNKNKENNDLLSHYLTGLFEGDGHIWLPKEKKGSKKHNPRFCITFHIKDKPLVDFILSKIGYGFIRIKKRQNACVLTVSPVKGLKYLIELINGKMRTPKILQLYQLIDWINKNHKCNYLKLGINQSNLQNNHWLAGFSDADASFQIRYTKKDHMKIRIGTSYVLEQRKELYEEDYKNILLEIAKIFNTKLYIINRKSGHSYYRIVVSSKSSLNLVLNYFDNHKLLSSKYLDYKDWSIVTRLFISNKHLLDENKLNILDIKNRINSKRTEFNWKHFYEK